MPTDTEQKIKVVHLITLLELGGAQGNTIYTVQNLNPRKHETHLWTGKNAFWDDAIKTMLAPSGRLKFIPTLVRQIHPLKDILAVWHITRELRKLKPAILHTHSSKAGIVGRIAGKLSGVPIIIHTFHGFGFNEHQRWPVRLLFVFLEKWVASFSTKLIFVSRANIKTAEKYKIGHPSQYLLIRSGIPIRLFNQAEPSVGTPTPRVEMGIPEKSPIVLTVGPFKPQKNLFQFLEMAKEVSRRIPDAHFVIVGDGELRSQLEKKAATLQLKEKIHMPGWRTDVPRLLSISKVFTLTSLWEGLPRSLLESMAAGIPSVCFETDGVADILSQGGGVMIKKGDIQSMADAIENLISDERLWQSASKRAKELVTAEFDIDSMVQQQEDLYAQLFARSK